MKDWPNEFNATGSEGKIGTSEEALQELKKTDTVSKDTTTLHVSAQIQSEVSRVILCERYSNFDKLLRVTALVLRFIRIVKREDDRVNRHSETSTEELDLAKILWYKEIQRNDECLKKSTDILGVFEDKDGVLRCRGRIQNSSLSYSAKFPVLLPRGHHFTRLIIWKCHATVKHNGVRETLTELRSNYWIIKGRQEVKRLIFKCVLCRKLTGRAYGAPPPPPLPHFRLSDDLAFSKLGIDFAGPLFVRDIYTNNPDMHKCYIALFTCASTRAIHLELTPDLRATTFIRVLKRLFGRRGLPSFVISDNGKTFRDRGVQRLAAAKNIVWKFNVPKASWWGGFFEICVKLVKKSLRKVLGNAKLSYEELETVLVEIEGVLNSRPLTYVYEEFTESPLTPSCLVSGRRLLDQSSVTENIALSDSRTLSKRARYLELLLGHFHNRWKNEYLTGIREYQRLSGDKRSQRIKVGDVVHLRDKPTKSKWHMGKVEKLLTGKDNIVRAAEVVTLNKSSRITRMKRPLQKLYPLEVSSTENVSSNDKNKNTDNSVSLKMVRDEDVPQVSTAH